MDWDPKPPSIPSPRLRGRSRFGAAKARPSPLPKGGGGIVAGQRAIRKAGPTGIVLNRLIWLGLAFTAAVVVLAGLLATMKMGAKLGKPLPDYGQVADFTLTNQDGQAISLADLRGKVWVADIIFTRCAGPCPTMTRQMSELQAALPAGSQARLVTLTTDADFDSPSVLKTYGKRFGANFNRWWFLTGTPKQVANLAIDSLKLTAIAKKPEERQSTADLFIHSTIFVVIDKHGSLRGIFETIGDGADPVQVKGDLLAAVRRLERES